MRILITGGKGQLGRSLQCALSSHAVTALGHAELDVADAAAVVARLEDERPDVVVHCAALTDTARCEADPALARAINGVGSQNVAAACHRVGATIVALSTNEVFDGRRDRPYPEADQPAPVNAYGISKLDGEVLLASTNPSALIVRTSWLYGAGYVNFVEKVRRATEAGSHLAFVTDEIATPTSTDDVAEAIATLVSERAPAGTYHLVNSGEASRLDWAREILLLCGRADKPIEGVTTAQLRAHGYTGPQKPAYSVLLNTRAAALGIKLRPWRDALAAYMERSPIADHV